MKIKISVGAVEMDLDGLDLNRRQLKELLEACGSIALAIEEGSGEEEAKQPIGFAAQMDLDPERNYEPDLTEWFEESP
ncbi:MAG TPA: hypothetical protein VIG24_08155 [Acidimicrobiia bacterium]